jgi:hypothetical protein
VLTVTAIADKIKLTFKAKKNAVAIKVIIVLA